MDEMMDGIMTFDEYWPELRKLATFRAMLADFGITEKEYEPLMKDWVVYYADLPSHIDGHTEPKEIQLNSDLEPFNRKLTFIHELNHALQYATGKNEVKFKSDTGELNSLEELKEYISDPGEKQAARNQLHFLAMDNCMDKKKAWEYMKLGWGMDQPVIYEVESIVKHYFDTLWREIAPEGSWL